jgi:hypothetical protein
MAMHSRNSSEYRECALSSRGDGGNFASALRRLTSVRRQHQATRLRVGYQLASTAPVAMREPIQLNSAAQTSQEAAKGDHQVQRLLAREAAKSGGK